MQKNRFLTIFLIFLISRIILYLFGYIGNILFGDNTDFIHCFARWDSAWYMGIVNNGYDITPHAHIEHNASNWAFFPLFSILVKLVSLVLPISTVKIAFIINNLAFLVSLFILYKYLENRLNSNIAYTTILLVAFSPYSIYFSIPYSESLFFLLVITVFYLMQKKEYLYAGLFAMLLSATRTIGVMIVFPILVFAIEQIGFRNLLLLRNIESHRVLLSLLIAPLGLFIYMQYLYFKVGDALAFSHIQRAWGRALPHNPLEVLYRGFFKIGSFDFYISIITAIAILLIAILFYKKLYAEAIFSLIAILIPLSTGLFSMPRFIFALFPIYVAITFLIEERPRVKQFILILFILAMNYFSITWTLGKSFMV